jgi:glycosyltransferase involved in cell wall biosynthesis
MSEVASIRQNNTLLLEPCSIVIPAYNEEKRIVSVLNETCEFISNNKLPWEVIIAVDGNDNTNDIVEKYHKFYSFVTSRKSSGRSGMGGAIRRGITSANGKFIILMDADGSANLQNMLNKAFLLEQYDVLNFNRYSLSSNFIPIKRRLASRGLNLILKTLFGISVRDTQCGYKIIKKEVALSIANKNTFSNGFFLTAFFLHSKMMGIKVTEEPLCYKHTDGSKFNLLMTSISYLVSIFAFWTKNSGFYRFVPISLTQLYYRKFRYL